MTHTLSTTLNDVDLESVAALINTIQSEPESASTTWAAQVTWKGAFRSEAEIRDFTPVASDEPTALGGDDTAPNPVEQLLAAFGNCLAVGYAANATAADIAIHELTIDIEGALDLHAFLGLREGHAGFDSIRATVKLVSDAAGHEIAALHEKVTATSPVGHTLSHPIPVSVEIS
jgi:uncharacterized OsmC-like protein